MITLLIVVVVIIAYIFVGAVTGQVVWDILGPLDGEGPIVPMAAIFWPATLVVFLVWYPIKWTVLTGVSAGKWISTRKPRREP